MLSSSLYYPRYQLTHIWWVYNSFPSRLIISAKHLDWLIWSDFPSLHDTYSHPSLFQITIITALTSCLFSLLAAAEQGRFFVFGGMPGRSYQKFETFDNAERWMAHKSDVWRRRCFKRTVSSTLWEGVRIEGLMIFNEQYKSRCISCGDRDSVFFVCVCWACIMWIPAYWSVALDFLTPFSTVSQVAYSHNTPSALIEFQCWGHTVQTAYLGSVLYV